MGTCQASSGNSGAVFQPPTLRDVSAQLNKGSVLSDTSRVELLLHGNNSVEHVAISNFSDFRDTGLVPYSDERMMWDVCKGRSRCVAGEDYYVFIKFFDEQGFSSPLVRQMVLLTRDMVVPPVSLSQSNVALEHSRSAVATALTAVKKESSEEPRSAPRKLFSVIKNTRPELVPAHTFSFYLEEGMRARDVAVLQQLLALLDGVYPEAEITGVFDSATRRAVERFQLQYGVADANDPAYGFVGPQTRAMLEAVFRKSGTQG